MHRHRLRRLFAILFATVFFGASMLQVVRAAAMPMAVDMPVTAAMPMAAHDGAPDKAPMPCKGTMPACMTDLGCVFMIGVAFPLSHSVVRLSWLPVAYQRSQAAVAGGRARVPDLRPPIRSI